LLAKKTHYVTETGAPGPLQEQDTAARFSKPWLVTFVLFGCAYFL